MKKFFYCNKGTVSTGPFTLEQLKSIRTITKDTLIWTRGMQDWEPAEKVRDLEVLFTTVSENAVKGK